MNNTSRWFYSGGRERPRSRSCDHFDYSMPLLERARRENVAISVVLDATNGARPTSVVRKVIAERADALAAQWPEPCLAKGLRISREL